MFSHDVCAIVIRNVDDVSVMFKSLAIQPKAIRIVRFEGKSDAFNVVGNQGIVMFSWSFIKGEFSLNAIKVM